jgi:hypothetical protein
LKLWSPNRRKSLIESGSREREISGGITWKHYTEKIRNEAANFGKGRDFSWELLSRAIEAVRSDEICQPCLKSAEKSKQTAGFWPT